jgi:subfamily B ATP-binding cassette protein HlyB/CyaB
MMQAQWEERLASYVRTSFDAGVTGALGQNLIQYVSKVTTALILFSARSRSSKVQCRWANSLPST